MSCSNSKVNYRTHIGKKCCTTAFNLSADSGPSQTILHEDTLSIVGGTGISTITSNPDTVSINLDNTNVVPGTYTNTTLTVDSQGRLTFAENGAASSQINTIEYSVTLEQSGVVNEFVLAGVNKNVFTNITNVNHTTPFGAYNNHVFISISSITTSGSASFTVVGDIISESTAVPISGSETVLINSTNNTSYQTLGKFLKVNSITFTNVTSITYDIAVLGYIDFLNTDVKIVGYRAEVLGDSNSSNSDITIIIDKIKQTGSVTEILPLENITINNPIDSIVDNLRTASFDRSYTYLNGTNFVNRLWPADTDYIVKQTDFNTYFGTGGPGEATGNTILGSSNEGLFIKTTFENNPPNGARYISLQIYYERI